MCSAAYILLLECCFLSGVLGLYVLNYAYCLFLRTSVWCSAVEVIRCAVLRYAVLYCAVRCGAVRCGAVRCGAVRCCAALCCAVLCYAVFCSVVTRCAALRDAVRCGAVRCRAAARRAVPVHGPVQNWVLLTSLPALLLCRFIAARGLFPRSRAFVNCSENVLPNLILLLHPDQAQPLPVLPLRDRSQSQLSRFPELHDAVTACATPAAVMAWTKAASLQPEESGTL